MYSKWGPSQVVEPPFDLERAIARQWSRRMGNQQRVEDRAAQARQTARDLVQARGRARFERGCFASKLATADQVSAAGAVVCDLEARLLADVCNDPGLYRRLLTEAGGS